MPTSPTIKRRPDNRPRRGLTVTVNTNVDLTLTIPEVQLLRFFADQSEPPPIRLSRYTALHSQGLIYHIEGSSRYLITELGRRTLDALGAA